MKEYIKEIHIKNKHTVYLTVFDKSKLKMCIRDRTHTIFRGRQENMVSIHQ